MAACVPRASFFFTRAPLRTLLIVPPAPSPFAWSKTRSTLHSVNATFFSLFVDLLPLNRWRCFFRNAALSGFLLSKRGPWVFAKQGGSLVWTARRLFLFLATPTAASPRVWVSLACWTFTTDKMTALRSQRVRPARLFRALPRAPPLPPDWIPASFLSFSAPTPFSAAALKSIQPLRTLLFFFQSSCLSGILPVSAVLRFCGTTGAAQRSGFFFLFALSGELSRKRPRDTSSKRDATSLPKASSFPRVPDPRAELSRPRSVPGTCADRPQYSFCPARSKPPPLRRSLFCYGDFS